MLSNQLQETLNDLHSFTENNLMKINVEKTKIFLFNTSRNFDFPPELLLPNLTGFLDVIGCTKLLGIQLTSDLKWSKQTEYICQRASSKFWMLRRMKILNIDPVIISDFYFKEIRSILEMACQVYHSGLTKKQSSEIESIQKKSLKIILGDLYDGYDEACSLLSAENLAERRDTLCLTFVKKAVKSGLHSDIFVPANSTKSTRSDNNHLKEYTCNTKRFFNSPLSFLSGVLNQNLKN